MALTDKLTAIADAIREKTGGEDKLTLEQMAEEIANIQVGADLSAVSVYVADFSVSEDVDCNAGAVDVYRRYIAS